jgi:hypothetical protein
MTAQHHRKPRQLISTFLSITLLFLLISASFQSRSAHAVSRSVKTSPIPSQTSAEPRITFDPSAPGVTAGTKVTITAKVLDKDGNEVTPQPGDVWTWKVADQSLEEFLMVTPNGNQASVVGLLGNSTPNTTRPNLIPIIVTFKGTPNATGVVNVRLDDAPLARGPIPPGINPQVDVMWAVMPQKITHDNFGSKIKKQYYGIEVVIGNDSGYDLELASVGFDLNRKELKLEDDAVSKIPSTGYRVARASLQRRQQLNLRNITLNVLKALGPVLTGFTPFFHNINHTNNFVEGVNVLTNPIEKGFEFVWPDLTVGQLANLEDQSLRDNSITRTVVKNNTQVRFVVFVPKDLINSGTGKEREWRDKPLDVMRKLGKLILVGDQVEHINRVRVVSSADTGAAFSISGRVTDPCLDGVEGATVTLTQAGGFSSTETTDDEGRYNFDNVPSGVNYTVTASKTGTTFKTPSGNNFILHGNRSVDFSTEAAPITISGTITRDEEKDDRTPEGIKVKLTKNGTAAIVMEKTTDKDGKYEFPNVPGGIVYTVTPSLDDRVFEPASRKVPASNCEETSFDFEQKPKQEPK